MAIQKVAGELVEAVSKNVDEVAEAAATSTKKVRFRADADGQMYIPGTKKRGRPSKVSNAADEVADSGGVVSDEIDGQMSLFGYGENTLEGQRVRQNIEKNRQQRSNVAQQRQEAEGRALDKAADDKMAHQAKMEQMKAEARERIQQAREGRQRTLDTRAERAKVAEERAKRLEANKYIPSEGEKVASARMETQEEFNARKDKFKQELTERKIQRESGTPKANEPVRDRQANPLTTEERQARGLSGQSKAEYDTQVKAERRAEAKSQKAFNDAQEKIDRQNQGLVKRTLGNISDAGKKFVSNINDVRTGAARQRAADFASDYNEILRKNGSTDFIDIKGGRKLQGQYEGMSAQQIYDAQQQAAEEAAAKAEEFSKWWAGKKDGITEFAKENPMITAAGIAGTAIIGASLLDND